MYWEQIDHRLTIIYRKVIYRYNSMVYINWRFYKSAKTMTVNLMTTTIIEYQEQRS